MAQAAEARNACAESIALLHLLHSVPAQPFSNPVGSYFTSQSGRYTLPFEKERLLSSTLAFLSSINDDPNHISAICVQEDPVAGSLRVLIAVNKAKWGDNQSVLQRMKRGFEEVFSKLSLTSPTAEGDIFAAIVSMCSTRILCRLRLSGRKALNRSMRGLLQEALQPLAGASLPFAQRAKHVIKLFDSWMNHQTLGQLQLLVQSVYELSQVQGYSDLLDTISNREMDPSSRKSLINMLKKIARYRRSARFLYRIAKKFPIAQTMQAIIVTLPENAFRKPQLHDIPPLDLFLRNTEIFYGSKVDRSDFFRLLQCSELQASNIFTSQTKKTLSEAKIHAEMQLIFHCEAEQYIPFPRVISSSKDACFLCNAFIGTHGKFYTTRCHGRLYPGWRLPMDAESTVLRQRFVEYLQNYARNSIRLLLSRRKRTTYPDPTESTAMTVPVSASTLSGALPPSEYSSVLSFRSPETPMIPSAIEKVDQAAAISCCSQSGAEARSHAEASSSQLGDMVLSLKSASPTAATGIQTGKW